jgi:hypothetical protein
VLFRSQVLEGIRAGTITLAFRRWRRPTVKPGGTLLTAAGQLSIGSVTPIDAAAISDGDARRAGYPSGDALRAELNRRGEGEVFRIELGPLRPDPRIVLRQALPGDVETSRILDRLRRLDARAAAPWTRPVLELIDRRPAIRAGDLCASVSQPLPQFKLNVRKLKALGLTESLEVGYRLSPRGTMVLRVLRGKT